MTRYNTYDVAVMNYPLYDPNFDKGLIRELIRREDSHNTDTLIPIYIHIPFCDNLCDFCIYDRVYAKENSDIINQYVDALLNEIKFYAQKQELTKNIGAVFIGGGTPTVLNEKQLSIIISTVKECFYITDSEITVECNIANASKSKLQLLYDLGVTRISTGIQTFDNALRRNMNIQKNKNDIFRWVDMAMQIGFSDYSTDLIYGFPQMQAADVLKNVSRATQLGFSHISVYKLSIFAYTKLYRRIQKEKIQSKSEDELEIIFNEVHNWLIKNKYYFQTVQEYGKAVRFWDLTYSGYGSNLSFGASSMGYLNGHCYQNETDVNKYIKSIQNNEIAIGRISRKIMPDEERERAMIMGFRKGRVYKNLFKNKFNVNISDVFEEQINHQSDEGLISEDDESYFLTQKGIFRQGVVSADYMISQFKNISPLKKRMAIGNHELDL